MVETVDRLQYLSIVSTLLASSTFQRVVIVVSLLIVPHLHCGCKIKFVTGCSVQVLPDGGVWRIVSQRRLTVTEVATCRPSHRQRCQEIIPRLPHPTFIRPTWNPSHYTQYKIQSVKRRLRRHARSMTICQEVHLACRSPPKQSRKGFPSGSHEECKNVKKIRLNKICV